NDSASVTGATWTISDSSISKSGGGTISFAAVTGLTSVFVYGGGGDDTFDVTASLTVAFWIHGGGLGGGMDPLNVDACGDTAPVDTPFGGGSGEVTFATHQTITYFDIENTVVIS